MWFLRDFTVQKTLSVFTFEQSLQKWTVPVTLWENCLSKGDLSPGLSLCRSPRQRGRVTGRYWKRWVNFMTDECCRIENFKSRYASIPAIREVEICSKEFKARYQVINSYSGIGGHLYLRLTPPLVAGTKPMGFPPRSRGPLLHRGEAVALPP